jgi:hypothetical protein
MSANMSWSIGETVEEKLELGASAERAGKLYPTVVKNLEFSKPTAELKLGPEVR